MPAPATLGPGLVFRPEAAILGGARWSQVGVNELPLFCHPFEWTGQNLTQIFKVYQQSATQFEKIFHLKIKSCIECEMVEFLPLIRNDEFQLHVWTLSVCLMEANGPGPSDLCIEELKC